MELIVRSEFVAEGDKIKKAMQDGYGVAARAEIQRKLKYYRMMRECPNFEIVMPHAHYFVPKGHWVTITITREKDGIAYGKGSDGEFWGVIL